MKVKVKNTQLRRGQMIPYRQAFRKLLPKVLEIKTNSKLKYTICKMQRRVIFKNKLHPKLGNFKTRNVIFHLSHKAANQELKCILKVFSRCRQQHEQTIWQTAKNILSFLMKSSYYSNTLS